jgi:hypothetical protein
MRAKVTIERLQNFETLRIRLNDDFSLWLWFRSRLWVEHGSAGSESLRWKVLSTRRREFEGLP